MADLKISQLNSLAGTSLANNDELAIVDTSASETKKITSVELVQNGYGLISAGTLDGDIIEAGTTSARGTIQLTDSTSSTSTTTAATPSSVKTAYDLADAALPKSGGTMSGVLLVNNGASAAAPDLVFSGDADTGIYSPGANQVALATGGTGRLFIDSSGNVGIGTSSPSSLLEIKSSGDGNAAGPVYSLMRDSASPAIDDKLGVIHFDGKDSLGDRVVYKSVYTQIASPTSGSTSGSLIIGNDDVTANQQVVITGEGNVGIGTTSPAGKLHVDSGPIIFNADSTESADNRQLRFNVNGYNYAHLSVPAGSGGALAFAVGTSGAATERLRIDSSGRLLVGTSSSVAVSATQGSLSQFYSSDDNNLMSMVAGLNTAAGPKLNFAKSRSTLYATRTIVADGDQLGRITFSGDDGVDLNTNGAQIAAYVDGTPAGPSPGPVSMPGRLVFSTTANGASSLTERMRISRDGSVDMYGNLDCFYVRSGAVATTSRVFISGRYSATSTQNGTESFRVYTNGNVQNTNNSYAGISDIKLKKNIVDASSQWDDIKALRPVNYNFKEGQTHTQLGLIAQEVELVSPGLVSESPDRDEEGNDLGTVTKSVNYSVLYMKAVKALQEAMERIETLEARLAAAGL